MVSEMIGTMNKDGAWIETFTVHDITRTMEPNFDAVFERGSYLYAVKELEGIATRTFMRNMRAMLEFYMTEKNLE